MNLWPAQGIEAGLGLHGEDSETPQFQSRTTGADGSLKGEIELPLGSLQASYGSRFDRRAQVADSPLTRVIGESMSLSGTSYLSLAHPHANAASLVVSNANRSQVFVAGIDYQVLVVGTETRLQRLIGGRILEGETVLVDYDYDVGGTYAYRQLDQSVSLGWSLSRYVALYWRRMRAAPRLLSGEPSFPLNEIDDRTWGLHLELPFNVGVPMSVGFNAEREHRQETLSPYRRGACDAWWQTDESLFGLGFLRAAVRRSRIDYANLLQNSDLRGSELRYWARHRLGMDFTMTLGRERDDAGLLPRQRKDGALGVSWQERRFSLAANWVRTWESQGGIERRRMMLQVLLRRDF